MKLHTGAGDAYFALATAPSQEGVVELLVKRGGRVADAAIAGASPGGTIDVSAPTAFDAPVWWRERWMTVVEQNAGPGRGRAGDAKRTAHVGGLLHRARAALRVVVVPDQARVHDPA